MKSFGLGSAGFGLAILFALAGCSGGGSGGGSSGAMFVETCSLGCTSGAGGQQVSCGIVLAHINQDIAIYFSEPVDPNSVTANSLVLVDVNSGGVPPGIRRVDPLNPKKVFFRPAVSFDTAGNPSFGFQQDHTYRVLVPGQGQGDAGPFITSTAGKANKSRVQCDIHTTLPVVDTVAGSPTVTVLVSTANLATPDPLDFTPNVPANAGTLVTNVWRNSTIKLVFNDLMNPVTLAPGGIPTFIRIEIDVDGDLSTDDRQPMFGQYSVAQDTQLLTTTLTFIAAGGIPSSADGDGDGHQDLTPANLPRKVVITIPPDVVDLAGNGVVSEPTHLAGVVAFQPEFVPQPAVILPDANGENFTDQGLLDGNHSGAKWAQGRATRGWGGGSGRLGELHVEQGEIVTLNTDSQSFPLTPTVPGDTFAPRPRDILDNLVPGVDYFPDGSGAPTLPPALVVTDGIFEFTNLQIDFGGTLILKGSKPARLFSRGPINMGGVIDLTGKTPVAHASDLDDGGAGAPGGPNAGDGGKGATRADTTDPSLLALTEGGHNYDQTVIPPDPNGSTGGGVGRNDSVASGIGGIHNPDVFPLNTTCDPPFLGTMVFSNVGGSSCSSQQIGSPGGGGAYGTGGFAAQPATPIPNPIGGPTNGNLPSVAAPGGNNGGLGLEAPNAPPVIRKLEGPNLRGGSGGGGGGSSLYDTESVGFPDGCTGGGNTLQNFRDHSACGGGGGGGGLQIVSGKGSTLSGLINASGGSGGNPTTTGTNERTKRAEPGGGGSGGAVRVQAATLTLIGTNQTRVNVSGGIGGSKTTISFNSVGTLVQATARGGAGGAGLIRLETRQDTDGGEFTPDPPLTRAATAPFMAPTDTTVVGPDSENILSVGTWTIPVRRPDSYSAVVSCWLKPSFNFFQIVFRDDNPALPGAAQFGWNMDIRYDSGSGEQLIKYRGPDPNLPFTPTPSVPDFEAFIGNRLNHGTPANQGSYFAVRFQGALSAGTLTTPCNVSLDPADGQIATGSITPWVQHPAQLNQFSPHPNMVRFSIVFDTSLALPNTIPGFIKGVTNLQISALTD